MSNEWFDNAFRDEREEIVEVEDELLPIIDSELELDFIDDACICDVNPNMCEIHNPKEDEEE